MILSVFSSLGSVFIILPLLALAYILFNFYELSVVQTVIVFVLLSVASVVMMGILGSLAQAVS